MPRPKQRSNNRHCPSCGHAIDWINSRDGPGMVPYCTNVTYYPSNVSATVSAWSSQQTLFVCAWRGKPISILEYEAIIAHETN